MIERKTTNHSISGFGVPITSASKRMVLPSLPSASRNFLRNSGGVDAFRSLTYSKKESCVVFLNIKSSIYFGQF